MKCNKHSFYHLDILIMKYRRNTKKKNFFYHIPSKIEKKKQSDRETKRNKMKSIYNVSYHSFILNNKTFNIIWYQKYLSTETEHSQWLLQINSI